MLLSLYVMDSPFLGVPERGETYDAPVFCNGDLLLEPGDAFQRPLQLSVLLAHPCYSPRDLCVC